MDILVHGRLDVQYPKALFHVLSNLHQYHCKQLRMCEGKCFSWSSIGHFLDSKREKKRKQIVASQSATVNVLVYQCMQRAEVMIKDLGPGLDATL